MHIVTLLAWAASIVGVGFRKARASGIERSVRELPLERGHALEIGNTRGIFAGVDVVDQYPRVGAATERRVRPRSAAGAEREYGESRESPELRRRNAMDFEGGWHPSMVARRGP